MGRDAVRGRFEVMEGSRYDMTLFFLVVVTLLRDVHCGGGSSEGWLAWSLDGFLGASQGNVIGVCGLLCSSQGPHDSRWVLGKEGHPTTQTVSWCYAVLP